MNDLISCLYSYVACFGSRSIGGYFVSVDGEDIVAVADSVPLKRVNVFKANDRELVNLCSTFGMEYSKYTGAYADTLAAIAAIAARNPDHVFRIDSENMYGKVDPVTGAVWVSLASNDKFCVLTRSNTILCGVKNIDKEVSTWRLSESVRTTELIGRSWGKISDGLHYGLDGTLETSEKDNRVLVGTRDISEYSADVFGFARLAVDDNATYNSIFDKYKVSGQKRTGELVEKLMLNVLTLNTNNAKSRNVSHCEGHIAYAIVRNGGESKGAWLDNERGFSVLCNMSEAELEILVRASNSKIEELQLPVKGTADVLDDYMKNASVVSISREFLRIIEVYDKGVAAKVNDILDKYVKDCL